MTNGPIAGGGTEQGKRRPLISPSLNEALRRALVALRRDTSARCVLLTDRHGEVVARAGSETGILDRAVLEIMAEEVSIAARLGARWNGGAALSLHHYELGQYDLYTAAAADLPFLLVAVSWARAPAYSAVVWLFVRRTMQELRGLLRSEGLMTVESEAAESTAADESADEAPIGALTLDQARALGLLAEEAPDGGGNEEL